MEELLLVPGASAYLYVIEEEIRSGRVRIHRRYTYARMYNAVMFAYADSI